MKRTQRKDALRNILKQKVSYASIVVIAMLAVMAYLGISFAAHALSDQAARFFDRMHFRDAEVISTLLLNEEDLAAIRAVDGVKDVEAVYQTGGTIEVHTTRESVAVVSLTDRVNTVELKDGRLPQSSDECVLEYDLAKTLKLSVGDKVRVLGAKTDIPEYLKQNEFTVVGFALHPDFYCSTIAQLSGQRYVLVRPDTFDHEALRNCCMRAVVAYDKPDGTMMYDRSYTKLASAVTERVKELTEPRAALREAEVRGIYEEEIANGQKKLDDAKKELDEGRKTLDEKQQELKDGEREFAEKEALLKDAERQLKEGKQKLEDADRTLKDSKQQLDEGKAQLDAGKAQLDAGKRKLDSAKNTLNETYAQIEDKKADIRDRMKNAVARILGDTFADAIHWAGPSSVNVDDPNASASTFAITDNISLDLSASLDGLLNNAVMRLLSGTEYESRAQEILDELFADENYRQLADAYDNALSGLHQWDEGHEKYLSGLRTYRSGEAKYRENLAKYNEGLAKYEDGLAQYEAGLAEYEENLAKYNDGLKELEKGRQLLEDGRRQLREGEEKYAAALAEYEEGLKKLADAKAQLEKLDPCRWVVLDADGNVGYVHAKTSAQNISRIGMTFSLLLVLVGALVIYATCGRMIEEQRRLVGTTKSLGFFNREVLGKYLVFGLTATLLGVVLGTLIGYFVIEKIVLVAHQSFYTDGVILRSFRPIEALIAMLAGALLSFVAVWSACASLVRAPARELMQERVPAGPRRAKRGKSRLSLRSRLILRNVRSDKKRVIVTMISIAGCCTLLMIGFTLQHGISKAISKQFDEVMHFEQELRFDPDASETAQNEIEDVLIENGVSHAALNVQTMLVSVHGEMTPFQIYTASEEALTQFYTLTDVKTGQPTAPDGTGLMMHKRFCESMKLDVGDKLTVYDGKMNPHTVTITGIYDNYFGRIAFLSEEGYRSIFGSDPVPNTHWLSGCKDAEALNKALYPIKGYKGMSSIVEKRRSGEQIAKILTLITAVLIICSGLMAYFILLNLTGMYLAQKQRELTVMRINGFTTKEVIRYVSGETVFTTGCGIVLGVGLGLGLGYAILRILEQMHVQFVRTPSLLGIFLSVVITAFFSAVINAIALRKVKKLKLTDVG